MSGFDSVAFGGGLFVAIGYSTNYRPVSCSSPNGAVWVVNAFPTNYYTLFEGSKSIAYGNGQFIRTTPEPGIIRSTDGVVWERLFIDTNQPTDALSGGVCFGDGKFLVLSKGDYVLLSDGSPAPMAPMLKADSSGLIRWNSQAASSYQVQASTNILGPIWANEGEPIQGNGTELSFPMNFSDYLQRFYRIQVK